MRRAEGLDIAPDPAVDHVRLLFLALYTRMIRLSVAETMHEDFVRTARAKGAGETRVLAFHVLPSASLRVLTMIGMEIGTAIGVAIFVEAAFGIRGLGAWQSSRWAGPIAPSTFRSFWRSSPWSPCW